jgi:hypothetical protein
MTAAKSEKQYNNFTGGLVTEVSPLTFPENAALDLDNFVLERNGKISRRLGMDYEFGYALKDTGISTAILASSKQSFHKWESPNGDTTVSIGVIRIYDRLWFINLLQISPSANFLNGGNPLVISGLANADIETTTINNQLVIVSSDINRPILLTYDRTTQLVTSEIVPIQVRDIWGVVDTLPIDSRPTTLTQTHNYNLINQGWNAGITSICAGVVSTDVVKTSGNWLFIKDKAGPDFLQAVTDGIYNRTPATSGWVQTSEVITSSTPISIGAIECTKNTIGVYPSNCDTWTLGKIGDASAANFEKYDPNSLVKNSIYKVEAAKGAFILDAYDRGTSRRALTGLTTLPADTESGRVTTVASFASRAFYSGINSIITSGDGKSPNYTGYIFFSQIATSKDQLGKCYQVADPTSPTINDVVATDGGTIQIPEITKIYKLLATRTSLVVFAQNGVWEIFGDTGGFTATGYQISKISSVGTNNAKSVVEFSGGIIYWAKAGIFVLTQDPISGRYQAENLTISTIQSLYNSLSSAARDNARGYYDEQENRVRWIYNDSPTYSASNYLNKYNRELVLDLNIKSFYTNSISPITGTSPSICAYVEIPRYLSSTTDESVYVDLDPVQVTDLSDVVVTSTILASRSSQFSFLTLIGSSFTLSKYNNTGFRDWISADSVGANYSSFLVTGYELFGEMLRKKQVPYLVTFFEKTEDGFELDDTGELQITNPSSCLIQAQWNWANSASSGKWGSQFQAYRFRRNYTPSGSSDVFDTGEEVISTKNKLRGMGRVLSLKIESEDSKDLRLLGWGVTLTGGASV